MLEAWDPDIDPTEFADGRGHAHYELFTRLRAKGVDVTIGPRRSGSAAVVVVFSKDLGALDSLRFILRFGSLPSLLIESDWSPRFRIPIRASFTATASPTAGEIDRRWLPLLPQRGMIPRGRERFGEVRTIGFKGDSRQHPGFLTDTGFLRAVDGLGLTIHSEDLQASRAHWHDFSATDVVLCMRDSGLPTDHKPPTKLINAWVAGCVPIVGREAAYLALASDGVDALFVDGTKEVVSTLQRLATDRDLVRRLEAGVAIRRGEYSVERVLSAWQSTIEELAIQDSSPHRVPPVRELLYWAKAQVHNLRARGVIVTRPGVRAG